MSISVIDLAQQRGVLAGQVQAALRDQLFQSRLVVTPRRLSQLADEVATSFLHFAAAQATAEAVGAFGRKLADEGLGHAAALAMVETVHRYADAVDERAASVAYATPFLQGYMEAREAYLLHQQERTRLALERARAQAGG